MEKETPATELYRDTQLPIFLGTEFLNGYINFINDRDNAEYAIVKERFYERIYRVGNSPAPYRNINHWDTEGILLTDTKRGKGWRKFSIVELCWLKIVQELRDFDFGLDEIKTLKYEIFRCLSADSQKDDRSFLAYCLYRVYRGDDMIVVVDKKGRGAIVHEAEYHRSQMNPNRPSLPNTLITINLNKIYADSVGLPHMRKKNQYLFPLSEQEILLLGKIAFTDNLKSVEVQVKDKQIHRTNAKSMILTPDNAASLVREMLADGNAKEITLKQEKNGTVACIERIDKA